MSRTVRNQTPPRARPRDLPSNDQMKTHCKVTAVGLGSNDGRK